MYDVVLLSSDAIYTWTQSLLSLAHIINAKYKYIYIKHRVFWSPCWYNSTHI
jgi:hypothetical protein